MDDFFLRLLLYSTSQFRALRRKREVGGEVAIGAWQDPLALIAEKIRSGLRDRETHTYTLETGNRSAYIKVAPRQ